MEKECYEPKEVLVHRTRPTAIMPERVVPNYRRAGIAGAGRKIPGNIIMGLEWPEPVRELLAQVLIPYDLLYVKYPLPKGIGGRYSPQGLIVVKESWGPAESLRVFAHEIAHARQHAVVSIDGGGSPVDWETTPEARAYERARQRDWKQFGDDVLFIDKDSYFRDKLNEGCAEFMAQFWLNTVTDEGLMKNYTGFNLYEMAKTHAPHRLKWAEEWHERTKPRP